MSSVKNNIISTALGCLGFTFTLCLLILSNGNIPLQYLFLLTAITSFTIGYFRAGYNASFTAKLLLINLGYFLFILLSLNSWSFIFIPLAAFGMSAIGLFVGNVKNALKTKKVLGGITLLLIPVMYFYAIPSFINFEQDISYKEYTVETIPDFEVTDLKGDTIASNSYKNDIVIIDFWATWCQPCINEFREVKNVYDKYKDEADVDFLFISDEPIEKIAVFNENNHYNFPFVSGKVDSVKEKFKIEALPTLLVVKNGTIKFVHRGYIPGSNLEQKLITEIESLR